MSDSGASDRGLRSPREAEATGVQLVDESQDAQGQLVADAADEPAASDEESILLEVMGSDAAGTTGIRIENELPGGTDTASEGYVTKGRGER